MIIEKIEIENFGKFQNFTLDFKDGVNVIYGANEAGKSTICAFLYAMFYDLPSSKQKYTLREDLRKRYAPWSGGDMKGTVYFSHEGKKYVLKRQIGKTPRSTKISLLDGETWEEIKDNRREKPGEYFLGVGEDGFLKTIYISQLGAVIERGKNDEILERLSNLKQTGDEDISYQKTIDYLTKQKHSLISVGKSAGKIVKLEAENEALLKKLDEVLKKEEIYRQARVKKTEEEINKEKLESAKDELTRKKALAEEYKKYQAYKKAKSDLELLEAEREKFASELLKSEEKIKEGKERKSALECLDEIEGNASEVLTELEARNVVLEQGLQLINKRKDEAKKLSEEIESLSAGKKSGPKRLLLLVAIIIFIVSAVLSALVSVWSLSLVILSVLLGFFSLIPSKKEKELKEKLSSLQSDIEKIKLDPEEENRLLTEQKQNREKAEKILRAVRCSCLSELLKKLSEKDTIEELLNIHIKENSLIKENLERIESESKKLSDVVGQAEFSDDVKNYSGGDSGELENEYLTLQNELVLCEKRLTEAETTIQAISDSEKSSSEIKTEIEINKQEIKELKKIYDATDKALLMIMESYEDLKSDFAPLLSAKVRDLASVLSDGKYTDIKISDDYSLKVLSGSGIIDADYVSGGTYDLLYLSLRMGILKILFGDRIPMLILDDAFLQFDDKRCKTAVNYIKKEDIGQVLYFTCHKEQTEFFGKDDVNIINF